MYSSAWIVCSQRQDHNITGPFSVSFIVIYNEPRASWGLWLNELFFYLKEIFLKRCKTKLFSSIQANDIQEYILQWHHRNVDFKGVSHMKNFRLGHEIKYQLLSVMLKYLFHMQHLLFLRLVQLDDDNLTFWNYFLSLDSVNESQTNALYMRSCHWGAAHWAANIWDHATEGLYIEQLIYEIIPPRACTLSS